MRLNVNIFVITFAVLTLAGCANYKQTLTDSKGQTVTCEASGKSGILTGMYLKQGFDDCIASAKSNGFK